MTHTILGIDPGYDRMGWCILHKDGAVLHIAASGCVETTKTANIFARYAQLQNALEDIIQTYHPGIAALESVFFQNNAKTAMRVSEARGIALGTLLRHDIDVTEYTPLQVKSALTGNGRATKADIIKMVRMLTKGKELPKLDDEVDAIAIALCHSYTARMKRLE